MKILHITDLHFKTGKANDDQTHICKAIADGLTKELAPDFVFFTGDLVSTGNNRASFDHAWKILTEPLIEKWNISRDRFFICPGNHDLDRGKELSMIGEGIEKIGTLEELDRFSTETSRSEEFMLSFRNMEHYLSFQSSLKPAFFHDSDIITPLFTAHIRLFNERKVGIVSLNSAWRCKSSLSDRGRLLFPPSHLHSAFDHVKDCDVRFILMHHPISDFKEFVSRELERIIYRDYHLLFTGHIHGKRLDTHLLSEEGIGIVVGPAALTHYDSWSEVGCGFYDIDTDIWKLVASVSEYKKTESKMLPLREYGRIDIPFNSEKTERIELLLKFRQAYELELEKADDLLLPQPGEVSKKFFLDVFTDPVIYDTAQTTERSKPIPLSKIRDDYQAKVIYGEDKSGKTFLLEKLLLDYLGHINSHHVLPLLINGKLYESDKTNLQVERLIARKYGISFAKACSLSSLYRVCILVDDYDPDQTTLNKNIQSFLKQFPSSFSILASSEMLSNITSLPGIITDETDRFYLREVGSTQIRSIGQKLLNRSVADMDALVIRSRTLFDQLNIPVSYWTLSLFFCVADGEINVNLRSQFDLVQLYVEKLLDRSRFATAENMKIDFETFKSYLASLSHFLVSNNDSKLSASWADIVTFTESYRKTHYKFAITTERFMSLLKELAIFKKVDDERVTFRITGIFEYSLATHIYQDHSYRDELFDNHFLKFPNQWEYYSGLAKNDLAFLQRIMTRVSAIFEPLVKQYIDDTTEDSLLLKVPDTFREELSLALHEEIETDSVDPLTTDEKDKLDDEYRSQLPASLKTQTASHDSFFLEEEANLNTVERGLRIAARVYKNTDINDEIEILSLFDKLLTWAMLFGAGIEDELKNIPAENMPLPGEADEKEFWKAFIRQYMPLIVHGMIFHHTAQANMQRIFETARDKYRERVHGNQYKFFISALLVIELNPAEHIDQIKVLIHDLSNPALKHALYYKLFSYHLIRGNENKSFARKLRPLIMQLAASLWPNGRQIAEQQLRQQEK